MTTFQAPESLTADLWVETTEDNYFEALEAVPPHYMGNGAFLLGEPATFRRCLITGHLQETYDGYLHRNGKYWTLKTDVTEREFHDLLGHHLRTHKY